MLLHALGLAVLCDEDIMRCQPSDIGPRTRGLKRLSPLFATARRPRYVSGMPLRRAVVAFCNASISVVRPAFEYLSMDLGRKL
jgi:hypothetical protein